MMKYRLKNVFRIKFSFSSTFNDENNIEKEDTPFPSILKFKKKEKSQNFNYF